MFSCLQCWWNISVHLLKCFWIFHMYKVFPSTQKMVSNILSIPLVEFISFKKLLSYLSKQVLVIKNVGVCLANLCKCLQLIAAKYKQQTLVTNKQKQIFQHECSVKYFLFNYFLGKINMCLHAEVDVIFNYLCICNTALRF